MFKPSQAGSKLLGVPKFRHTFKSGGIWKAVYPSLAVRIDVYCIHGKYRFGLKKKLIYSALGVLFGIEYDSQYISNPVLE